MLAAANRLGDAASFREVTRRGRRAGSRTVVVHTLVPGEVADGRPEEGSPGGRGSGDHPVFGLVVSRAVGNSVVRNRVKRRLRHLLRARLGEVPGGSRMVVRALPAAAEASSACLARDLDLCLGRVLPAPQGRDA